MIDYITYREPFKGELEFFILQKEFPHYCGRIVKHPVEGAICNAAIAGYNLWVSWAGTLRGNMIPNYKTIETEIQISFSKMADWYLANRILNDEKRYKNFKLKSNVPST